jgi:hypothetical protein
MLFHRDDHFAPCAPRFQLADRLGSLRQRVAAVDERDNLTTFE